MVKAIGNMWTTLKWWLLRPISKASFYWKNDKAGIHMLYFYDNSIYLRFKGRTGYEIAMVLDKEYVEQIKDWLNRMYEYEEGSDVRSSKKIVPINRKFSIQKPPTSTT